MEDQELEEHEKEYKLNQEKDDCPVCDQKIDREEHSDCEGCGNVAIYFNHEGQGSCKECGISYFSDGVRQAREIMKKVAEDHDLSDKLRKDINFFFEMYPEHEDGEPIHVQMDENGKWIEQ